jgi:hypothetical protein
MTEPWQSDQQPKRVDEIIAQLFEELSQANMRYATDQIQHDEWSAEMRRIDQKLTIFGLRLDRPERFTKTGNRI